MAEDCLRTIRENRADSRAEEITQSIGAATHEQKIAMYQQIMALNEERID